MISCLVGDSLRAIGKWWYNLLFYSLTPSPRPNPHLLIELFQDWVECRGFGTRSKGFQLRFSKFVVLAWLSQIHFFNSYLFWGAHTWSFRDNKYPPGLSNVTQAVYSLTDFCHASLALMQWCSPSHCCISLFRR